MFVLFPADRREEADAYLSFLNVSNPDTTPGAAWSVIRTDRHGRWVVPYLGPGGCWNAGNYPEPKGGAALRATGTLVEAVEWPVEEEA